jgi:hypothetical protein
MYILDDPFVSDLLRDTILQADVLVLDTPMARRVFRAGQLDLVASDMFAEAAKRKGARLYSNSENAIDWIATHLADTDLPRQIGVFKDKVAFRELVRPLYPAYVFEEVPLTGLGSFDPSRFPKPFVIKPAVGFFSLGVHVVESDDSWPSVVESIREEVARSGDLYPPEVLGLERYIVEQKLEGEEFAIDAFFDADGKPVIVGIMGHLFAGPRDVSDRAYYASPTLVGRYREQFTEFLDEIGRLADLHDFPVHAEVRVNASGQIVPIEINPMRFGGWCGVDMTWHAFGINPYTAYMNDLRPDWPAIAKGREGRACGLVVADFPGTIERTSITSVDYSGFQDRFSSPLELRPIDFRRHPVFAFLFIELPGNDLSELQDVLDEDLSRYLRFT